MPDERIPPSVESALGSINDKVDKIIGALFGSPDHDSPMVGRLGALERARTSHEARLVALEKSAKNYGLVEKTVFGVIALALTGMGLGIIKLVMATP